MSLLTENLQLILILAVILYLGRLFLLAPRRESLAAVEELENRLEEAEQSLENLIEAWGEVDFPGLKARSDEAHELALSQGAAVVKLNQELINLKNAQALAGLPGRGPKRG